MSEQQELSPQQEAARAAAQDLPGAIHAVHRPSVRGMPKRRGKREFIVIGLGRFGSSLAKGLVEHKHDVLAVDADYHRVQMLAAELPHVLQIDATNIEALREIGAEDFDTGIVCIGEEFESSILSTVLLYKLGVRRIIAKARTRTQRDILLQIGADEVILPEHEAGRRLAQRLSSTGFVDYLQLGPNMGVVEMLAPEHLHGQTLAEADLRRAYGLTVLAVRRNGQFEFNLPPDTRLQAGDELLVVGNIGEAIRLCE
ncbi:MAG: TrkA family potassium uptake protein [Pseudomonadota bacterium]|nr:TrkA family potassium uptake protein [Pseudomonadota bacterium]